MKRLRKLNIIIGDEDAIINVDNVVDKGGKITKRNFDYFLMFTVSFIPFFVFGFWSLFLTKLQKYKNIT